MANGKGTLDCSYCRHFDAPARLIGVAARCNYHAADLPADHWNRVCVHFEPDQSYWQTNSAHTPPALRFTWFRHDLKPGVLYFFHYNAPQQIEREVVLREPDYMTGEWKPEPET